jgi:hypothetical protein
MVTRREFLDTLAVGAAGLAVGASAKSYGQIMGANERLSFAVIGLNSRACPRSKPIRPRRASRMFAMLKPTSWPNSPPLQRNKWATRPKQIRTFARSSN